MGDKIHHLKDNVVNATSSAMHKVGEALHHAGESVSTHAPAPVVPVHKETTTTTTTTKVTEKKG